MKSGLLINGQIKKPLNKPVMAMQIELNEISSDPEANHLFRERVTLKHEEGCNVCEFRYKEKSFAGVSICSDNFKRPLSGQKYCHHWQLEG